MQPHFIKISMYNGRSISEHVASCCGTQKADVCRRYFTLYSALSTLSTHPESQSPERSAAARSPKPEARRLGRGDGSFAFSSSLVRSDDDEKISKFKNTTRPDRHSNVCTYVRPMMAYTSLLKELPNAEPHPRDPRTLTSQVPVGTSVVLPEGTN